MQGDGVTSVSLERARLGPIPGRTAMWKNVFFGIASGAALFASLSTPGRAQSCEDANVNASAGRARDMFFANDESRGSRA